MVQNGAEMVPNFMRGQTAGTRRWDALEELHGYKVAWLHGYIGGI